MSSPLQKKRAVFLDRDGVLNHVVMRGEVVSSPRALDEFSILPEAEALCESLRREGWMLIVVTNQPDVARGNLRAEVLEQMHAEIQRRLNPDAIEVCTSGDNDDRRRKPNPGMLLDAAESFGIDLGASWILGDSAKDIGAGKAAGVRTLLLRTSYNHAAAGSADFEAASHAEAIRIITQEG